MRKPRKLQPIPEVFSNSSERWISKSRIDLHRKALFSSGFESLSCPVVGFSRPGTGTWGLPWPLCEMGLETQAEWDPHTKNLMTSPWGGASGWAIVANTEMPTDKAVCALPPVVSSFKGCLNSWELPHWNVTAFLGEVHICKLDRSRGIPAIWAQQETILMGNSPTKFWVGGSFADLHEGWFLLQPTPISLPSFHRY